MSDELDAAGARSETWDAEAARQIAVSLAGLEGACMPVLHAIQAKFGYVDKEAIAVVADVLNLSRAEVVGVAHFYSDFRHEPPGSHHLRVCRAESCQAVDGEAVVERLTETLGCGPGETSADGAVMFDAVYCLGNCALSPALMWDGRLVGRVTPERAAAIVSGARV